MTQPTDDPAPASAQQPAGRKYYADVPNKSSEFKESTMKWGKIVLGILAGVALVVFIGNQLGGGSGVNFRSPVTLGDGQRHEETRLSPKVPVDHASPTPTEAPAPVCDVPGSVFVKEIGQCVYHMTDPVQVQKYSPDMDSDPKCKGKPAGFRYDEKVTDESGRVGIAHRVCGSRSAH